VRAFRLSGEEVLLLDNGRRAGDLGGGSENALNVGDLGAALPEPSLAGGRLVTEDMEGELAQDVGRDCATPP
jgi:hypothetical protein